MGAETRSKINRLSTDLPDGLFVDAAWLERRGYYATLRKKYVQLGWLMQPARGVYRRPLGPMTWQQVVVSLQVLICLPIVVGGRSALELQGFSHYLAQKQREIHLYSQVPLPAWVKQLKLNVTFVFHKATRLFSEDHAAPVVPNLTWDSESLPISAGNKHQGSFITQPWGQWNWPLTMSTPERAILELLDELPDKESFHQVDMLMGGLSNLSPRRTEKLLIDCHNVKVKRLFFFFADRHHHAWLAKIDKQALNLGKGKRSLVPGGKFNPVYQITVPEDLNAIQ